MKQVLRLVFWINLKVCLILNKVHINFKHILKEFNCIIKKAEMVSVIVFFLQKIYSWKITLNLFYLWMALGSPNADSFTTILGYISRKILFCRDKWFFFTMDHVIPMLTRFTLFLKLVFLNHNTNSVIHPTS